MVDGTMLMLKVLDYRKALREFQEDMEATERTRFALQDAWEAVVNEIEA